ncbi:hypothetical protein [Cohnella boryungensis]|uniref:LysM domain-containing protein n=1 Tax=Cohnella boryungensis TaxID=768479 RepID=A0ABV8S3U8_9BACL
MKNTIRTLGVTAALAMMIPLSVYAATTSGDSASGASAVKTQAVDKAAKGGERPGHGGFGIREIIGEDVLALLKLDQDTYQEKVKAGSTLAEIAEEQGVSRESLKSALTAANDKKLAEMKQKFADNLDNLIDSKLQGDRKGGMGGAGIGAADLSASAKALGLSEEELKEQLKAGETLAELAASKGVDVQTLIDAQAAAMTTRINEAVKSGKLTQEQADKQLEKVAEAAESVVNGKGFGGRHHGGDKAPGGTAKPDAAAGATETAE